MCAREGLFSSAVGWGVSGAVSGERGRKEVGMNRLIDREGGRVEQQSAR